MTATLNPDAFVAPTPAGAYLAATGDAVTPTASVLRALLRATVTPRLSPEGLASWLGDAYRSDAQALGVFASMVDDGLVEGLDAPLEAPGEALEALLPDLIAPLSADRRALLADEQGFCLATVAFGEEATEIAALAADVVRLSDRHTSVVAGAPGIVPSPAWGSLDARGCSRIGYWPLAVGEQRFVLVLGGLPLLARRRFVDLVWSLAIRYDRTEDGWSDDDPSTGPSTTVSVA